MKPARVYTGMKESTNHVQQGVRLIDSWGVRIDRDPAEVVQELRRKVPEHLRVQRPLTEAEQRLWHHLANPRRMGIAVFQQVPVHVPAAGLQRILTFYVPAFSLCVEVSRFDFAGDLEAAIERMALAVEADEMLRETVGIVTLRVSEHHVLEQPEAAATMIRWELGLTEECGFTAFEVPR